jgi:hypothetical protein
MRRSRDLYLLWSSIVDAPTWVGNRAELADHLRDEYGRAEHDMWLRLIDRADQRGTSDRAFNTGGWDDESLRVGEGSPEYPDGGDGYWVIRRDRLTAYAEAILAADDDDETVGHDLMDWQSWDEC